MKAEGRHQTDGEITSDTTGQGSESLPQEINSPQAKLVYLYLDLSNGATVGELEDTLALKKITILSILESLSERDLVERTGSGYITA
ncbi:MarR family transcriptional regulator [Natrialbaceae archaeon A-gly3]